MKKSKRPHQEADFSLRTGSARDIPSRERVLETLRDAGKPIQRDELLRRLKVKAIADQVALDRRLQAMLRDGVLLLNRHDEYGLSAKMDLLRGQVIGHADGFGFLRPEGGGDDLFLPPYQMRRVLHGDVVLATCTGQDARGRREAMVVEILQRRTARIVGRFLDSNGYGIVVPDDKRLVLDLRIPRELCQEATPGDVVVAHIDEWPDSHRQPLGRILRVLGPDVGPMQAVDLAIETHGLATEFAAETLKEALRLAKPLKDKDWQGARAIERQGLERVDLRALPLVTIDGEDARDFDDAVYAERTATGFRLFVAIADVASYVTVGSALDKEARARGTSVYFPRRVLPMLPEQLSNGMCSLKPDEDRYCLVAELLLDARGQTRRSRFYSAVMRSKRRLTYSQVWAALSGSKPELRAELADVWPSLENLYALYQAMAETRRQRGALEFEGQEVRFLFDETGVVSLVQGYERNDAHRLIEECMIAANVAAAKFLQKQALPALFRVHAPPPMQRYEDARPYLESLGISLPPYPSLTPQGFAAALKKAQASPQRGLLEGILLRLQSLAVYQAECTGHFGLALTSYSHFTSPIRRYPDLLVHRAIHHALRGGKAKTYSYTESQMQELGKTCSALERRADEAGREVDERLKLSWLAARVGQSFEGTVVSVASFGAFVEIDGTRVSGLLHVTQLPGDYYHFDAERHRLVGERTGACVQLGQTLKIKVLRVDEQERKADFALQSTLATISARERSATPRPAPAKDRFRKRRR